MAQPVLERPGRFLGSVILVTILAGVAIASGQDDEHPLEPPDRSSPRATLTTFLGGVNRGWDLYSNADPGYEIPFRDARNSLDLSEMPPLVVREASAEATLFLKDVLDRIELPAMDDVPDRATVQELGLTHWAVPHTEIRLTRIPDGELAGQWLFSARTVRLAEEYYDRVSHLPYRPGQLGGHVEELRSMPESRRLMRVVERLPSGFKRDVGDLMVWQWCALASLVALVAFIILGVVWLGRQWRQSGLAGYRLASFLAPLTLIAVPAVGGRLLDRLFVLQGPPIQFVDLTLSIAGRIGFAWLVALALTRFGDLITSLWLRDARPLRKQFVRLVTRIATIVVVTIIALSAAQSVGVPVAGLIAGLGVGGLAIALASQNTLENFIGGVILYADQPVRVGDFCAFGDRRGTVEDVGLRSVKIRTMERTQVTVPNADFARLQLENLSGRDRILLREELCVAYETTREQLVRLLAELRTMLADHPRIANDDIRVRFVGYGTYFVRIELFAYAMTVAWAEFLEIREDVLLRVMELVERSGTRMALPTEVHYLPGDAEAPRPR